MIVTRSILYFKNARHGHAIVCGLNPGFGSEDLFIYITYIYLVSTHFRRKLYVLLYLLQLKSSSSRLVEKCG